MVAGRVIASEAILQPIVELLIYGQSNTRAHVHAIVDTGFTEQLTLPGYAVDALDLQPDIDEELTMADGEPKNFKVYSATVDWNDQLQPVRVHRAEGAPLIGMAMLRDHDLYVRVVPDGLVNIDPLA